MEDIALTFYHNVDPRRKQELADSRMIQEDHNAPANLSPKPIYEEFNQDRWCSRLSMFNQTAAKKRR